MTDKFVLHINCANDAFMGDRNGEVARILRKLASDIEEGYVASYLTDENGNTVGYAEFKKGD